MNNPSWCCEQIEELIKYYKNELKYIDYSSEEKDILCNVIIDLEKILYE